MKTKQIISIIIVICCIFVCSSCNTKAEKHILKAWSGGFSDAKLTEAITLYKAEYTPIKLDSTWQILVPIDETFSSYRISRISYCDDEFGEFTSYIDLTGISEYNNETRELIIDCSWLNDPDSWIYSHNTWSYLINVSTDAGEDTYYYVRVMFSN